MGRKLDSKVTTKQITVAMAHVVMMRRETAIWWWAQSQTTKEKDTGTPICSNGNVCVSICVSHLALKKDDNLGCLSVQVDKVEGTRLITRIDGGQHLL